MFDLLNKKQRLRVLEDGHNVVQVVGLREDAVYSAEDVLNILRIGTQARCVESSSRLKNINNLYILSYNLSIF